jgi:thymidylate synthase
MEQYLRLLDDVLYKGEVKEDRTGTGTHSVFGTRMAFDLCEGFPLLTTKQVPFNLVASELLWFIKGPLSTRGMNIHDLKAIYPNNIWDEWADDEGYLGPIYGSQWRSWPKRPSGVDQLQEVINSLRFDPDSRRHIVSSWNVSELSRMALPPCHLLFQFNVEKGKYLNCQMYQRSCDMFLGVPFNIASYALLIHMVAYITDLKPGRLIWVGGDTHIYKNHTEQVSLQLQRTPTTLPTLNILDEDSVIRNIDDFTLDNLEVLDYKPQRHIAAPISV